jgi:hypothetical protein
VTWCHVNPNCGRRFGDSRLDLASSHPDPCQDHEEKLAMDEAMQNPMANHGQDRNCARKRASKVLCLELKVTHSCVPRPQPGSL